MKRKILVLIVAVMMGVLLTGCSRYTSSYKATILVTTNYSGEASMSFSTFSGTKVFKIKSGNDENVLKCHASLSEGSATVYYDYDGTKRELCTLNSGEEFDENIEIDSNSTIYIIVETNGTAEEGRFEFEVDSSK